MRYYIYISLIAVLSVFCFNNAMGQGVSVVGNNNVNGKTLIKSDFALSKLSNADSGIVYIGADSIARILPLSYVKGGGGSSGSVDSVTISNDSLFYWGGGVSFFVGIVNSGGSIDTTGLSDRINYNLTRINALSDSVGANRDSINVHRTAIDGKEPSITPGTTDQYWQGDKTWQAKSGLPISTATQTALDGKISYSDTTTIIASQDYVNNAIAAIPPLDTSNIVARIDSNANSINILDSTAYIGKPVNVQRVMLEGQSNCDGSDVDTSSLKIAPLNRNQFELLDTFNRVYTWDYTNNVYKKLKAGSTNYGRTGASFGAELSYAARWEKNNPDGILVIDKKCLYGQTIDQFQKGTTQYTTILNDRPLADKWLTDRGYRVKNTAWVFIQGESDLDSAGYQYLAALNQLVSDKFSDGLIDSTTRLVISQVSTSAPLYGAGVDSAQVAFVNAAPNRKLINNDANTLGVGNHYNAAGYVQLGLSAYTQSFDADSLKTLDEYVQYKGVGSIFGRLKVENSAGSSNEGASLIGANAQLQVAADNFSYVPMIVHSTSNEVVNSSFIWCTADTAIMGTLFAVNNAFLIRGWLHKNLILGANNSQTQLFLQRYTNNVGINTVTPHSRLHVSGSVRVTDTLHALGNIYANGIPAAATKDSILAIESNRVYKVPMPTGGGGGGSTAWGDITGTLSDQTDLQSELDGKQDTLGFTAENVANKATDFSTVNNTLYPTVEAVDDYVASELSGYLPAATAASTYVSLSGSYSNPTWITALAWSKITSTPTTLSGYGITDAVANTTTVNGLPLSSNITLTERFQAKIAGELDTLTTGVKLTFRMPANCIVDSVKGAVNVASTSGDVIFDLKKNGTTMMATNKILIEATETSSRTATQPPVLTTTTIADDDIMTLDVISAGTNAISGEFVIYWRPN